MGRADRAHGWHRPGRCLGMLLAGLVLAAEAGSAVPEWLRTAAARPLPAHDADTPAVVQFAETVLTVRPDGRMRRLQRLAVRILRPEGEDRGLVRVDYDAQTRVTGLRGWCLPAQGREFETRDGDIADVTLAAAESGVLVSDLRSKLLRIPAAVAGSVVGYEVEQEGRPYFAYDEWVFQDAVPVGEAHYRLYLPPGWSYRATWLNGAVSDPQTEGPGQWHWMLSGLKPVRIEKLMPPWRGVGGRMVVALVPPFGRAQALLSWRDIGNWFLDLARDRIAANPGIRAKVLALTAGENSTLGKIRALARFVQSDIRYVAIHLGIGGYQPHAATEVYANRYGDCKDKSALLASMLREIGVESYFVVINTVRGSVVADTPPNLGFDHVILAIRLPDGPADPTLPAQLQHPQLGRILFFDPTDELTPLGRISGNLQASHALVAVQDASQLLALPQLPPASNGVRRTGRFVLDTSGSLRGDVDEERHGDTGAAARQRLRSAEVDTDRIRSIEHLVANSLSTFRIVQASAGNLADPAKPVAWRYSLEAERYAKLNGDLLLVRPRVLGVLSESFLEVPEPREHAIEFAGPAHNSDVFEIALPAGFGVEELPPPVDVDLGFAAYHSSTVLAGNVLRYTRTLEYRQLSVPAVEAEALRGLYRQVHRDERALAVLTRSAAP